MKKRSLAFLMCLVMVLSLLPSFALAASEEPVAESAPYVPEEHVVEAVAAEPVEEIAAEPVLDGEGPQRAQSDFTVRFEIAGLPAELISSDLIVRMDREGDDGNIIPYTGSNTVANFSAAVSAGEWAIFGYQTVEGYTAAWSNAATMHEGLYAQFSTAPSNTVVLTYSQSASGSEPEPEPSPDVPTVATADFTLSITVSYPEGYTGEKNGGLQRVNENREPISGEVYADGDTVDIQSGDLALFTYVIEPELTAAMTLSGSGGYENVGGVPYVRVIAPGPDGAASVSVTYGENSGNTEPSDEPTGEIDYAEYYNILTGDAGSVSTHSAVVSATYWAPYSTEVNSCEFSIYYGLSASELNTLCLAPVDGGEFDPTGKEGNTQTRTLYALHAGTTYYYRAVLQVPEGAVLPEGVTATEVDGRYFLYGETKSFTTAGGTDTSFALSAPANASSAWTECTVSPRLPGMTDADANGCVMAPFTVDTDGTYRISMEVTEPADSSPYANKQARDRQLSASIRQQAPIISGAHDLFALQVFFETIPNDSEFTSAILDLKAGVNYYFLVDNDGADWTVKFEYAAMDNDTVEYEVDVSNIDYTFDSRPQRQMLKVDFETESSNTLQVRSRAYYDLASNYSSFDEFKAADTEDIQYSAGTASGEMGAESGTLYHTMNYCVEGQKYYYKVLFESIDPNTGSSAFTSTHTGEFIANYGVDRILAMGENHDSHGNATLASAERFMHTFRPESDGLYQFTFNKQDEVFDLYSSAGTLLTEGVSGSRQDSSGNTVCVWTTFQAELKAGQTYYVFFCLPPDAVVPIVTVSRLTGETDLDENHVQTENTCEDTLSQNIGLLLNDLTKLNGEDVPLPDYVVCTDAEGEAALREAIEEGATLAPTMTGTALATEDLDEELRTALTTAAGQASGGDVTEISTVDLSVMITLDSETVGKITELDEELTFYLIIPENQREALMGKTVRIFRCHEEDGQTEIRVIKEFVYQGEERIPFQTSRFSVFSAFADGLADAAPTPTPTPTPGASPDPETDRSDIPQTGDSRQPALWALLFVSMAAALTLTVAGRKRSRR